MDLKRLQKELERHEGIKYAVYLDTEGLPTVGIGHLLTEAEKKTMKVGTTVSKQYVDEMFAKDIQTSITRAMSILGKDHFEKLSDVRKRVLVNMAFNMGNRLAGFKKFLTYVREGRFQEASVEMLDSKWAKQVKNRANELSYAMKNDQFNF